MSLQLLAAELARWDEMQGSDAGALLITFFADERPLRGAAGLADWRLCGRLSALIRRGKLSGTRGETLLLPPGRRLKFSRLLLFGLGTSQRFNEDTYRDQIRWIRDVAARAKLERYALQPPGRATGLIGARRALELWLEQSEKDCYKAEVLMIDNHSGQKDMGELLRYHRKKSG